MLKLCIVAGARPNFMKIAPIIDAIKRHNEQHADESARISFVLVHTGQHYDQRMSELFFDHLGIPAPDINLEVGSGSHAAQTSEIMKRFEPICLTHQPTHVVVVGDVNSTIACALVAAKLGIQVVHVEAGLRSFDRTMPEEINRVLTDAISDVLFITERSAEENLLREGIAPEKIHFVGNVMIDTLLIHKQRAAQSNILRELSLLRSQPEPQGTEGSRASVADYAVLTLHRPSNVDNRDTFEQIIEALTAIASRLPILFPVHPRTVKRIEEFGFQSSFQMLSDKQGLVPGEQKIYCTDPLGYLDFLHLMTNAKLVLTDSGGIQEETTILGVPCVTLRENTERPITVTQGSNIVAGTKKENIVKAALSQLEFDQARRAIQVPPLWDGKAAERIVKILAAGAEHLT